MTATRRACATEIGAEDDAYGTKEVGAEKGEAPMNEEAAADEGERR